MNDIRQRAKELHGQIVEWRRALHETPEIGFDAPFTEGFIVEELKRMGADSVIHGGGRHGVVALIKGKKPGGVLGIRADYDALRIVEETELPFASKNGNMHACGHDAHTAMLLGTARLLLDLRDELPGTVKLIFQPSEEDGRGAAAMIRDGVLEDPAVDTIIGLHTGNLWKGFKSGEVGYRFGALMAAADWFRITFEGKGGHGATPHLTVDPLTMAAQTVIMLQQIVSREVSPFEPAVLTVGTIHGGSMPNIISESCTIEGTFRCMSREVRELITGRMREICGDAARAMRGKAEVTFGDGTPPLLNDRGVTEGLKLAMEDIVGAENVHEVGEPTMGAEDMALFQEKVPGSFFFLPASFDDGARDFPHHHPKFDLNEDVLWIGPAVMARFAMRRG